MFDEGCRVRSRKAGRHGAARPVRIEAGRAARVAEPQSCALATDPKANPPDARHVVAMPLVVRVL